MDNYIGKSTLISNSRVNSYIEELILESKTDDKAKYLLATIYREGILTKNDNKKATELLTESANNGFAPAQFLLSYMYYRGETGTQSFDKAFEWQEKAAYEGTFPQAVDGLGWLYYMGLGCKQDLNRALTKFNEAINLKYDNSLHLIGNIYECRGDYKNAIKCYKDAVDVGDKMAALTLGNIYMNGYGNIEPDFYNAAYYLGIAALDGKITEAKHKLGLLYWYGNGVFKCDFKEAKNWFSQAANEGHIEAQYNLAYLYRYGIGCDKDMEESVRWYKKAAERGHRLSQKDLADILAGYDFRKYDEAIYWYEQAAKQNLCDAHRILGDIYYFGIGVDSNLVCAINHYRQASDQGELISKIMLEKKL